MSPRPPAPGKSVAELHPHLLLDFKSARNEGFSLSSFSTGSGYYAQWDCHICGNDWGTSIANRALRLSGCRRCARRRITAATSGMPRPVKYEKSVAARFPELVPFWDKEENSLLVTEVGPGSEFSYHWCCVRGHKTTGKINAKISGFKKQGVFPCKHCYLEDKTKPKPGKSLGEALPKVAAHWHPTLNGDLTPFDVYAHANKYAWWLCDEGHETWALVNSKAYGYACKDCNTYNMSQSEFRVREALQAANMFATLSAKQVTLELRWRTRYVAEVDMLATLHDGRKVAIEYDGAYHHGNYTDVIERDLAKTEALLSDGYIVVRIREHDLFPVALTHENLVQVQFPFNRLRPEDAMPGLVERLMAKLTPFL